MLKKSLLIILAGASLTAFAEAHNASDGIATISGSNETTQSAYTQNITTPQTAVSQQKSFDKNNTDKSRDQNSPTVNSLAASNQMFPEQDQLTGQKGQKYNTQKPHRQNMPSGKSFDNNKMDNANQANSPTVNSRMYSGSQFPQQNEVTGHKKQKYYTKDQKKNPVNNPEVNSRLYSGAQFPQQNTFNNDGRSVKKTKPGLASGAQ